MLTKAELEYMTRMPNEVRKLRESIDKLITVLEPISKSIDVTTIDPEAIKADIEKTVKEMENLKI